LLRGQDEYGRAAQVEPFDPKQAMDHTHNDLTAEDSNWRIVSTVESTTPAPPPYGQLGYVTIGTTE
jgi:hypothetical protein